MNKDDNLREYIKKVFISPNVVAFGSEKARTFLESEFGLTISSLLRPFSVESSQEFIWPPTGELRSKSEAEGYYKDLNWELRSCRESVDDLYLSKDVIQNKPLNSKSIWVPINKLEGVRITLQESEVVNEKFGIKFLSLCDSDCVDGLNDFPKEFLGNNGMLNSLRSYDGFDRLFPYTDIISNLMISKGGKQLEYVLKEFFQFNINQDMGNDLVLYNNQLPFWFKRWFDAFNEEYSYLNNDNVTQPIGGIIFVDLSEEDPIESIIEITDSLRTGRNFCGVGGNSSYYIYGRKEFSKGRCVPHYLQESYLCDFPFVYIFINDESSNFNFMNNDQNIISSFKLSFPDSICYIWNIKGSKASDLSNEESFVVLPGTFCHPFKEYNRIYKGNRYFFHDELEQLNSFIIDSVKNVFIPWLETTINRLNNYVIQSRKGIKNHLRILWRRPRNDSGNSTSEGLLSTLGVGTVFNNIEERSQIFEHEISLFTSKQQSSAGSADLFGSNSDNCENFNIDDKSVLSSSGSNGTVSNSNFYYSNASLEGQTRILADLLLISGFYQQSVHFYKQILTEYKLDKSFLHIGSTLFSISIAQMLTNADFESVSNSCFSSSNYFQKNEGEFGKVLSIKPLLIMVVYLFTEYSKNELIFMDCDSLLNITKNLIDLLIMLSKELQNSNKKLRPRHLFCINNNYLAENEPNSFHIDSKLFSLFGVLNFSISIIIYFVSNNLILSNNNGSGGGNVGSNSTGNKFHSSMGTLYSNTLNMCIANTAQSFQKINLSNLSLQNYLIFLYQIKRFSYKYIEKYFKIHSARLLQKMSLFSQATIIYISLIMDIINERLNFNEELTGDNDGVDLNKGENFNSNKLNLVNFNCYNEFINSFSIYVGQSESKLERGNDLFNYPNSQSQLKIPLPILLPFGSLLILETDSDSFSRTFGREADISADSNCKFNCSCSSTPIIADLLKQNNFCNHRYHRKQNTTKSKMHSSTRSSAGVFGGEEDEFHSLVDKINALLEADGGLDSSEITELKSQYFINKLKLDSFGFSSRKFTQNQSHLNNSTRFSSIGKVCSVEFYLYNPLSFPIKCESIQLWGHLRIQDGSTGKVHIFKELDGINKDAYANLSGIVFFEKSITLEPNEMKIHKLSVLPLESGELFLLGISFFLEGKIPIRQNFSTCSVYFDKLARKFDFKNKHHMHSSLQTKENYGIQKVNILNHHKNVSITFGNVYKNDNDANLRQSAGYSDKFGSAQNNSVLYSGIKYSIPIQILNQFKNINVNKDSLFLAIPSFNSSHHIDITNNSSDCTMLNEKNKDRKDCQGFIFKLSNSGAGVSSEFKLSIWVNSKCKGSICFVLLNFNKTSDDHNNSQSGSSNNQLQSQSSGLIKGKVGRCITFANISLNFENSMSASCTVFPGTDLRINKLLLRVRNESFHEISIYDISPHPSKWLASDLTSDGDLIDEKSDCNMGQVPKIRLSANDFDDKNHLLNGNYNPNIRDDYEKLILIKPGEMFQFVLNLQNCINLNLLSIMNIDLVLSWMLNPNFDKYGNSPSPNCFGMICIQQISLSDPFSVVDIKDMFREKHQPLSLFVNTRSGALNEHKQSRDSKNHSNFGSLDLIEADIYVMNVSLDSTIICTMVSDSRISSVVNHEFLLVPSSNKCNSNANEDNCEYKESKHRKRMTFVLESGELNWIGTNLKHFKLEPRKVARFKLVSIIPFKGLFSTSSIKIIMRDKIPFLSHNNTFKGSSQNGSLCETGSLGFNFVCYLNWKPDIYLDGFKGNKNLEILKFQLKNPIDYLEHSPFSSNIYRKNYRKNNSFLPAYIEKKSKYNRTQKKNTKNKVLDVQNSNHKLMSSQTNAICDNYIDIYNVNSNQKMSRMLENDIKGKNFLYLLNYWIHSDESSNSNVGNVISASFSATHKSTKFEIECNKKGVILQKPSQIRYIFRT
ncbi:hypothetical protein FG386_000599 [Cryptosporidium ryanae]|uniref:uncharacterized protein n=1 Tax=Cryptosporidium ryanae TaxID=515981 RepID=UPI00351A0673|nr:hypothetical protein FG386_000599 [Cryptosporidium ryanae]